MNGYTLGNANDVTTKEREVKTYIVDAVCSCGGPLHFTGMTKMSNPPWYVHGCNACYKLYDLRDHFPKTEYRTIDSNSEDSKPTDT